MSDIDIFAKTTSCVDIKNDVVDAVEYEKMKEMKLGNELEKYKRAFEVLKPIINMDNNIEEGGKEYWLSDIWGLRKLTKEEYETLEELLKELGN